MFKINPKSLWRRYLFAVSLLAVALTGAHYVSIYGSSDQSEIVTDINTSGQQAMLSQRITFLATELARSEIKPDHFLMRIQMQNDLQTFKNAHEKLQSKTYISDAHRSLFDGSDDTPGMTARVAEFVDLATQIQQETAEDKNATIAALQKLASKELLRNLDSSARFFEMTAQEFEASDIRLANWTFAFALGLLILEGIFIFWPAHRTIRHTIISLEEKERLALSEAEAKEEALAVKSNFLNMMSHELRTPLNGILAGAELLKEDPDQPDPETVEIIQSSGQDLAQKVETLLQVAQKGQSALFKIDSFAPYLKLKQAQETAKSRIADDAIQVQVQLDMDPEQLCMGAGELFDLGLDTLVSNAVKYSSRGTITLSVSLASDQNGMHLLTTVSDTGDGISEHKQALLFEPFKQGEAGLDRAHDGLGLGLFRARKMLREAGGDMTLVSSSDAGSSFAFTLPVTDPPKDIKTSPVAA